MSHSGFSYAKKGLAVRLAYLFAALLSFILRRLFGRTEGVVVLCYHSILATQRTAFEQQMQYIKKRAVSLDRVKNASDNDAMVVVTFDDAYECLLHNVVPVVRALQVPITIFAVSGNLGKPPAWLTESRHPDADLPTMSADQLWQLAREPGVMIGSHSSSHRRLGELSAAEVDDELASSKASLQEMLGLPCLYLALPHGSYRPEVIDLAIRHGYDRVLTLDEISLPSRWPTGTVGRFTVSPDMWMIEFVLTVHGAYAWLHVWRSWIRYLRLSFKGLTHAKGERPNC